MAKQPPTRIGSFSEKWPPKPTWHVEDVPDLSGKTLLVTGGSAGIGKETCRVLVERNAKVYLATRSKDKAESAIADICKTTGKNNIHFLHLDLADLDSVRRCAEEFNSKEKELHALVHNAGVLYAPAIGPLTKQQWDIQFGVHVLGPFLLTQLLLPTLLRTAKGEISGTPCRVRVVAVSSDAHEMTAPKEGIVWDSLQKGDASLRARKKLTGTRLYGQSKLASWFMTNVLHLITQPFQGMVLVSSELARRYGDQGIVAISLHPGGVKSELMRNVNPVVAWIVEKIRIYPVSLGVLTSLYATTSEEALDLNGEYLTAWARRQVPSKHAQNPELAAKLWKWSRDLDGRSECFVLNLCSTIMVFCANVGLLDLHEACMRSVWAAITPSAIVVVFCAVRFSPRLPEFVIHRLHTSQTLFQQFLTLQEAEQLITSETDDEVAPQLNLPVWRPLLTVVGLAQCVVWVAVAAYSFAIEDSALSGLLQLLLSASWFYTVMRAITHPAATPPYDLFTLYCLFTITSLLQLGGYVFEHAVDLVPLPSSAILVGLALNLASTLAVLTAVLTMPLGVPSQRVDVRQIGITLTTEDYAPLWQWIIFSWIYPLVRKGTYSTLDYQDVWQLSPTLQSRPVFSKFSTFKLPTLLQRLWKANSFDIILDFVLTLVAVIFSYAGPFCLKRILDSIDKEVPTRRDKGTAYIYAFLMLVFVVLKAQVDLQHLYLSRRAATRIRVELIAAIYDKALKRKDYAGLIDKDKARAAAEAKVRSETKQKRARHDEKADDPKSGADVGKIVNLMAGDQTRVSTIVSGAFNIYGAPMEILVGSWFLYVLLGWSAFAGFIVLLVGWPLNSYVARRRVRMHKGELKARDGRMSVINELIGAVKFIKFFAWEERWIQRSLDAREIEMKWMIKCGLHDLFSRIVDLHLSARLNSMLFNLIWLLAPIAMSTISFLTFVLLGNKLTVGTAFTSITLFSMIRSPMNIIPAWVVRFLQTRVALNRIAVYLDEEEVSAQVSSLKQDAIVPHLHGVENEGLGLENASLRWNELPEEEVLPLKGTPPSSTSGNTTALGDEVNRFELRDISVIFPEGQLSMITGPTASGKTALLMALLGEMTLLPGGRIVMSKNRSRVDEHGNIYGISYAAQTPWLRHQSIRENILFGYPYDEARYNQVLECCALQPDLDVLEDGDATEIGARGVVLSGGQKARVALARAVYVRSKYVLLDDPLSAVDSHTARFLFEHLLCGPLLANRTVILVTHHVDLVLPGARYLVRMLDGRIDIQGAVEDLRALNVLENIAQDAHTKAEVLDSVITEPVVSIDRLDTLKTAGKPRKLVKEEHRAVGSVKWNIYNSYLKASSYWTWGFLLFAVIVSQLLSVGEKLWIKTWGSAYEHNSTVPQVNENFPYLVMHHFDRAPTFSHVAVKTGFEDVKWPNAANHPLFYVGIYAAICLATAFMTLCSIATQFTGALRASRILFKQLLFSVVRATFRYTFSYRGSGFPPDRELRFHDTTPVGRMLNRFGLDMEKIDQDLAASLQTVNTSLAGFFASVITITVVFPAFLFPAIALGYVYYRLALGYLNTGRDLRRMESNSRSPIYSDFGELLEGIVTVRATCSILRRTAVLGRPTQSYRHSDQDVVYILDDQQMASSQFRLSWWACFHRHDMTYELMILSGGIAVFITAVLSISLLENDAGIAGLALTSAVNFTNAIYWACRNWTTLEVDLNSVERVVEYLQLPQEPPAVIESNRPPAYWPSSSTEQLVQVENLAVKYSPELPSVLHDVTFTLRAGERVGLIGRTGSGKSTLAMSLLRFIDPVSGRVVIDGIDISTIGVNDLRSRITFIPQDATLFSGTLRDNLDPFGEHDDVSCIDVLYRVHLLSDSPRTSRGASRGQSATATPHSSRPPSILESATDVSLLSSETEAKPSITLNTQVSAGGSNFSQGQRQLIAMARALLRRSSVVVMDEATSSVDFETDAKIQNTIRQEFTGSLLITVAHRLRTIIDYDRLVVLDHGKVVELDTPFKLIQKEDGVFRSMCLNSGSFAELETAARLKAEVTGRM
ncbi:ABC bile acid [Mycena indigotica]|uniref:ABC bile acid n=1 Tax=Mycena indigotica TaxID=2126181 RepID=A0A8H6SGT9_9AGAR|nr:ABC bile acid [Mycena indigotica]KAF7299119.1 ABC bile acid [Mycena indigotica]